MEQNSTVTACRSFPSKKTSLKKLKKSIRREFYKEELIPLPTGGAVCLKAELGFMEMIYHVAVYQPKPSLLSPSRLLLKSSENFENRDKAVDYVADYLVSVVAAERRK